ncbi:hypothetical protein ACSZMQ_01630 [Aeromonas rivipollensis]
MFNQLTQKHVVVLPNKPIYSVDHADKMSLYSMEDARQEGAMGLSDMFLRDWAQGQTTRECTISGQAHQIRAI